MIKLVSSQEVSPDLQQAPQVFDQVLQLLVTANANDGIVYCVLLQLFAMAARKKDMETLTNDLTQARELIAAHEALPPKPPLKVV